MISYKLICKDCEISLIFDFHPLKNMKIEKNILNHYACDSLNVRNTLFSLSDFRSKIMPKLITRN